MLPNLLDASTRARKQAVSFGLLLFALLHSWPLAAQGRASCGGSECQIHLMRVATLSDSADPGLIGLARALWVQRTGQGRFFLPTARADGVAVFDSLGRLETTIGRFGSGPGEFRRAGLVYPGPGDTVFISDVRLGRITLIGPDLSIVRLINATYPPTFIHHDGSFIVAEQIYTPDRVGYPIHRVATNGRILTSFGADTPQFRRDLTLLTNRVVAPSRDGSVWAAQPGRYVIERWDAATGLKLAKIDIRPKWFRESGNPNKPATERPDPLIVGLWEDQEGLLWVLIRDADIDWKRPPANEADIDRPFDVRDYSRNHDWVLEVIDPHSERVIATRRFRDYLGYRPPTQLLVSVRSVDSRETVLEVWKPGLQPKGRTQ